MNNRELYEVNKAEAEQEDPEGLNEFLEKQNKEANASYPEGCDEELYRFCTICGALLKYRSMAYDEGFHFDGCI